MKTQALSEQFKDDFLKEVSSYWIQNVIREMNDKNVIHKIIYMVPGVFILNCRMDALEIFEKRFYLDKHIKVCKGCLWKLFNSLTDVCLFNKKLYPFHELYLEKALKMAEYESGWRYGWAMSRVAVRYALIGKDEKAEEIVLKALTHAPELLREKTTDNLPENTTPKMVKSMMPAVISMGLIKIIYKENFQSQEKLLNNLKSYFTEEERNKYWYIDALSLEKCSTKIPEAMIWNMIICLLRNYKYSNFKIIRNLLTG